MLYPMAKERKKPREEETAVCVLEWDRSGERKVLLAKRPEKGTIYCVRIERGTDRPSRGAQVSLQACSSFQRLTSLPRPLPPPSRLGAR
jgi:hypothetical protein